MIFSQRIRRDTIEQQTAERRKVTSSSFEQRGAARAAIDPDWYTTHGQGD